MRKMRAFTSTIFIILISSFFLTDIEDITVVAFSMKLLMTLLYLFIAIGLYWVSFNFTGKVKYSKGIILLSCIFFIMTRQMIDRMVLSYVLAACITIGLIHGLLGVLYINKMKQTVNIFKHLWTKVSDYSVILSIAFLMTGIESLLRIIAPEFYMDFFNILTILIIYNIVICSISLLQRKKEEHTYLVN